MPWSKGRSPRSWRPIQRLASAQEAASPPRSARRPRAGSTTPLGLLAQGRNRPDPDPQLAIRRAPDHRQVVGRTVLAVRRDDGLGHRPPAVYPRPLPGSRPGDDGDDVERRLLLVFAAVYGLALVRHSALLGYLSGRHIMALVYASVPWAAAGSFVCARGIAVKRRWGPRLARNQPASWRACLLVAASIVVQMQPNHLNHLSRMGPLGGRSMAGRPCRPGRAGPRHARLGPICVGSSRIRLLACAPGADRLASELHRRGPGRAGSQELARPDASGPCWRTRRLRSRSFPPFRAIERPAFAFIAFTAPAHWEGLVP